ncbi:hypothetical protein [Plantactinospora sp. BB1]|uniref:hypothetical protein n=1 Tax=Plantactinospora sp. BB1 TaxID=2071627 RepID=UPI000D1760E7|nr:hypothetical protein [Plantactinospora sp. BB1]AVT38493.1 hypothetical protein C6W10_20890 [Plantactinospora sp. BB1]
MPCQPAPPPPLSRADYRAAVRAATPEPAQPAVPAPPARTRATNRRHGWDAPLHARRTNRAAAATPVRQQRSGRGTSALV